MMQSFFVGAVLTIDDNGLFVTVDLEKTNQELNSLISQIHFEGLALNRSRLLCQALVNFNVGQLTKMGQV